MISDPASRRGPAPHHGTGPRGHGLRKIAWILAGLAAGAAPVSAHPLDSMQRILPQNAGPIHVTDWRGATLIATGDPQGPVLHERSDGALERVETGLPGVSRMHHHDGIWLAMAGGKWWRATSWPTWSEMIEPVPGEAGSVTVVNGEFWLWTWGGLRWHGGQATRVEPRLFRSADALSWAEVFPTPDPAAKAMSYAGLAWGDGRFVLVGDAYQMVDGVFQHAGGLWTSDDGTTWMRQTAVDGSYTSVAYGGSGWLAGGTGSSYAISADGATWSRRSHQWVNYWLTNGFTSSPIHSALRSVVWQPSGFHALATTNGSPFVVVSADGNEWQRGADLEAGDFPGNPGLFAVAGRIWLAGSGANLWRNEDWRWEAERVLPAEPSDWQFSMASPSRAVIMGDDGRAGWSDNGTDWHFATLPGTGATPVAGVWAADRGEFLAVGRDPDPTYFRVWRSADGVAWTSRKVAGGHQPVGLARAGGRYVVATAEGWLRHSENGSDWSYARIDGDPGGPFSPPSAVPLQALACDGHTFAAVTTRGGLVVSADGEAWSTRNGPVAFEQDREAGLSGDGGLWLFTTPWHTHVSTDLVEWHQAGPGVRRISHAFGEFVGLDGSTLRSSQDGLVWSARGVAAGVNHLAPFQNRLLGVGENGLILRSEPWIDFLEAWRQAQFSADQLADPAISGDGVDPDGDGLSNLLEYALGLDPLAADAADAVRFARVPSPALDDPEGASLRLEFPSWEASPGVTIWAEHSTDLQIWSRAGWRAGLAYGPNGTVRKLNGREVWTREIDATGPQRFLRLRGGTVPVD